MDRTRAIEHADDTVRALADHDGLIVRLRGVIADSPSTSLSTSKRPTFSRAPTPAGNVGIPGQQILDLEAALGKLDNDHHQPRERNFAQLARRGAAPPPARLQFAAPSTSKAPAAGSTPTPTGVNSPS